MHKDFSRWNTLKQKIDSIQSAPTFDQRDIWWCSIGVNVGYEILGKDAAFVRPVLVIQKFSHHTFLGVPLTSNPKKGYFRYPYSLNGKDGSILLDQIRTYDSRRFVGKRMGRIHPQEFDKLKQVMRTCFSL